MGKRRYKHSEKKVGASPGSLIYVGQEIDHKTNIRRIEYNEANYTVETVKRLATCSKPVETSPLISWLDIDGIHEPAVVERIGQQYHLHPLLLEDVMNSQQKPKVEEYDGAYLFATMKMLHFNVKTQELESEHLSFVMGKNYLISFQEERKSDIFQPVLDRIQASAGKTRRNGPDYLLYALMDLVVDHYFVVLDNIGEKLEILENSIIEQVAGQQTLTRMYTLKRELTLMRKLVWPVREMINRMVLEESDLIKPATMPFLRDLYDHVVQVLDSIDSYRELATSLLDVYLSTLSNRMNSVMKTLTIFSAIFMPLTFIVGVYGMNFDNMPELHTRNGYFVVLGVMAVSTVLMVIYFRRRRWF
ncbi:magnesium/cobalt transporter CorA [Larkinella rosea]|uniref:Magnesium transport protein CorA n=1 Tax=Larkinella rosea TaxID=2025312 RepID=A0A3P1BNW3_9BACT|nr:magnesium/cobalt transporter CorA [Larkinella rosea]RRB02759.1 magnesium/cobalt transporter CorA [Larkinella rosea]